MKLRRITLAAALAILPVLALRSDEAAAKAKFGDWLHDEMQHRALWLYGSPNLSLERAPSNLPPRKAGRHWVLSRDAQSGNVVYFVPGDIESVEIDSHRKTGSEADLTVSVSPDGTLWVPLKVAATTLEIAGEWEYRLLAAEPIPAGMTHLRVEFPESTKPPTLRLTEVWIHFKWDNSLLNDDEAAKTPAALAPAPEAATKAEPTKSAPAKSPEAVLVFAAPSVAQAAATETAPASASPVTAASTVRSDVLVAPSESAPTIVHEPASPPIVIAIELPREIPPAPFPVRESPSDWAPPPVHPEPPPTPPGANETNLTTPVENVPLPAAAISSVPVSEPGTTVAPTATVSVETQVGAQSAPAVSAAPAKKAVKRIAPVRLRRGPRSK